MDFLDTGSTLYRDGHRYHVVAIGEGYYLADEGEVASLKEGITLDELGLAPFTDWDNDRVN